MSWGVSSGLLDRYTATVDEAKFATDVNYRNGEVPQLVLTMVNIDNDEGVEVDEITEKWAVGNGYLVVDGGEAVEREDGNDKKKFNKNTRYGQFINRVVKNEGGAFDGLLELLEDRGDPKNAKVWEGLRLEFERVEASFTNDDKEKIEYDFILPCRFVGVPDGDTSVFEGKAGENGSKGGADARAKVKELAREADDFQAFVAQALGVPGVTADPGLVGEIGDESDAGLFATARS